MKGDYPDNLLQCIEEFLSTDHTRPDGLDIYPELFDTECFYPLQRKAEMERMMKIARTLQPKTVIDLGSDKGGGVWAWCKSLQPKRMISCEIRGTPYSELIGNHFKDISFLWLEESSFADTTVDKVITYLNGTKIDILFMDADKSSYSNDWNCYVPLMSSNGIVFMHDVGEPGNPSTTFINATKQYSHWEHIKDTSETKEALARQEKSIPCKNSYEQWLRHWSYSYSTVGVIYLDNLKSK